MQTLTATTAKRLGTAFTKTVITETNVQVAYDPNLVIFVENGSAGTITLTINQVSTYESNFGYADNEGASMLTTVNKSFGPFTNTSRWNTSGYIDMDFSGSDAALKCWCVINPVNLSEADTKD